MLRDDAFGASDAVAGSTLQRSALDMAAGVILAPPPAIADITSRDTLLTAPWIHPEMHETMPGLPVHTIATYFGAPTPRRWIVERQRFEAMAHPGAVTVIPVGWDGFWDIDVQSPVSYVFLADSRLQQCYEQFSRGRKAELVPRLAEPDPVGAQLLEMLSREVVNREPSARLFVEQAIELLCIHVLRRHAAMERPIVSRFHHGLAQWQVRRVSQYMNENLHRSIGLDELAGLVSLSRSHFCTAFRKATGVTPHEWLTRQRMQRACALLRQRDLSIGWIAVAVGYGTPSAFSSTFRRCMAVTPSQYRRRL